MFLFLLSVFFLLSSEQYGIRLHAASQVKVNRISTSPDESAPLGGQRSKKRVLLPFLQTDVTNLVSEVDRIFYLYPVTIWKISLAGTNI